MPVFKAPQLYRSKLKMPAPELERKKAKPTPRVSDLKFQPGYLHELFEKNIITNQKMSEILRNVKIAIGQRHKNGYLAGRFDFNHIFVDENLNIRIDWPHDVKVGEIVIDSNAIKTADGIFAKFKQDYIHLANILQAKFHLSNVQALVFIASITSEYHLDAATSTLLIKKIKKELFSQIP